MKVLGSTIKYWYLDLWLFNDGSHLALLFLFVTLFGHPEPNISYKWICSLQPYRGMFQFYISNLPLYINFTFLILISCYNFKVANKALTQVIPTLSQNVTNPSAVSLLQKKLKNANVFFKINISTILVFIPLLPLNIFLSYFNLTGENCDSFEHTRTFALIVGPLWFLHVIILPIFTRRKIRRFYNHAIL